MNKAKELITLCEQQLYYFKFELDNGNIISVEATTEEEAKKRAEKKLKTAKIVKSLGQHTPQDFGKPIFKV